MKTKQFVRMTAIALLLTINHQLSTCLAQGSLTPPGVPAPTMRSLDQIEPRTPISSAPFTIGNPGSYYLTGNLTVSSGNAITIATNGVALDLSGFIIRSTAASPTGAGIQINTSLQNITIANGFIQGGVTNNNSGVYSGTGFADGIFYTGIQPVNAMVSRVSVSGCLTYGILLGNGESTVVENCTARTIGSYGIAACLVKTCAATVCGITAIYGDQVTDCRGQSILSGDAIVTYTAENSYGYSGTGNGILAFYTAQNCFGSSNGGGKGVYAETALNCYGSSVSGDGIHALGSAENCYGSSGGGGFGVYGFIVMNCNGLSSSADGVHAYTAMNCYGTGTTGAGVFANSAQNCFGTSSSSHGISANDAENCNGTSSTGNGVYAIYTAHGCHGQSGAGHGVYAVQSAENCSGYSGNFYGVNAFTAQNCYGYSTNSIGIFATTALNCYGQSPASQNGITAIDAQNCYGHSGGAIGLFAADVATGCSGYSGSFSGEGVDAFIAAFCHGNAATNFVTSHSISSF